MDSDDDEYGDSYAYVPYQILCFGGLVYGVHENRLALAAKRRKTEQRLKEEFPDYDPQYGRSVRESGMVQGNLGGPLGGGAGMAMSGGI